MFNETNHKDSVTVDVVEKNSTTNKKSRGFLKEFVSFVLFALIIVFPIRVFIAQPFLVSGASMDPTFKGGDYLIVDELSYRFNDPERGDVIIFRFPNNTKKFFIKRIVGLPGESVSIINGQVSIIKNKGASSTPDKSLLQLEENYVVHKSFGNHYISLGEDEYYVLGDNRPASLDSRSWGVLDKDLIKGRAFLRLLPITKIGAFPGAL